MITVLVLESLDLPAAVLYFDFTSYLVEDPGADVVRHEVGALVGLAATPT